MSFISFLEENMLSCTFKKNFDVDCMGCGMQRSIIHLLKGEFIDAFLLYPAIYTLISMFLFLGIHLKFNFKHGGKILTYLFILNTIIILINFLIKLNH
ncbi:DUF2752 domain-containing protein [Urechidicola croceus]|uniref:DUF2752 domain-containing protein n=1 Tax=Urechidicola croceus TaxID=1850246 RepID=A0A1D8P4P3_9FLAO|nr:DUF2752 domain-containing protein [Urechidicola croceus]AOW19572.1 hypothetical protein LPB138_02265 [Urechidicola croceus]